MPIKITVERQTLSFNTDAVGIGRDPENQVALPNDTRLAPLHAVLRRVNDRWIIESRDGGPVRIGNGRPSRFSWVNPGDVIYLTETGPELVFELSPGGVATAVSQAVPSKTSLPASSAPPVSASVPYVPFIPTSRQDAIAGNNNRVDDSLTAHLGPHASKPVAVLDDSGVAPPISKHAPIIAVAGAAALIVVFVAGWAIFGRGTEQQRSSNDGAAAAAASSEEIKTSAKPVDTGAPPVNVASRVEVDPQEFLVLIGIGNLKSDDRPHILGVGWLWDTRTAIASLSVGEVIEELVEETKRSGNPRQGCAIQGIPIEVGSVIKPAACPEIAILRLASAFEWATPARNQWKKTNSAGIERQRGLRKKLSYYSFDQLPRPKSIKEDYGFPLCEYDPEFCILTKDDDAGLVYQAPQHFLKLKTSNLEKGGLLFDEDRKIVGMAPANSPVIWTEALERALESDSLQQTGQTR